MIKYLCYVNKGKNLSCSDYLEDPLMLLCGKDAVPNELGIAGGFWPLINRAVQAVI